MKIPQDLPQFVDKKVLIVSCGMQAANVYFASDGKITDLRSFRIKAPKYSDREGFFLHGGRLGLYGSGSVYEPKKLTMQKKFLVELLKNMKEIDAKHGFEELYLVASPRTMPEIKEYLPPRFSERLTWSLNGNYVNFGSLDLLRKIGEEQAKEKERHRREMRRTLDKPGSRKILKEAAQARKVIRKR